jgi:UDP-N-acetylglucosamine 2-epimerase (non-hydrolysing)
MTAIKKITVVAGARPNFIKIAELVRRLKGDKQFDCRLVHTGQHYDFQMSNVFFRDLGIPTPDVFLGVGSGSHAQQTARIITAFEKILLKERPDLAIVAGDVNSTLACALTAAKLNIDVAHIEAGLRSFDRTMPEEINRIVTDSISKFHFASEKSGVDNLRREGADMKRVFLVGNTMIDPLVAKMTAVDRSKVLSEQGLRSRTYAVLTLHRPNNVDSVESLSTVFGILEAVTSRLPVVYPAHPRTLKNLEKFKMLDRFRSLDKLMLIDPLGYLDFIRLVKSARLVLTDSGGIQEETTWLGIPCLTVRNTTERPSTISIGTNKLVARNREAVTSDVDQIMRGRWKRGRVPRYWDGHAAERIVNLLKKL